MVPSVTPQLVGNTGLRADARAAQWTVPEESTETISIGDCVFLLTVAYVPVGATVDWKNTSAQPHEVVGAHLTWGAHDKLLATGDTIGWTFDEPGVYPYSCMLHPGMTGAIVVGGTAATSGSAGGSSTLAGTTTESGPSIALFAAAGGPAVVGIAALALLLRRRGLQAPTGPTTGEAPTVQQG